MSDKKAMESDEESPPSPPPPNVPPPCLPPPLPARPKKNIPQPPLPHTNMLENTSEEAHFDLENEGDGEDEISAQMTASYSEISFKSGLSPDTEMPISLGLDQIESISIREHVRPRPMTLICDRSINSTKPLGPLDLEGTVHIEGNMTHFVAEDLEYKIKLSSPVTKKGDTPPLPGHSRSGTPNTLYRQILAPQFMQVDYVLLSDLECEAQRLATSIDNLTENLCGILHSISSITADNVDVYKDAVSKMSDAMDSNIKSMYTIMAKAEEVTQAMKSVQAHSIQVKEIRRLVDLFESYL